MRYVMLAVAPAAAQDFGGNPGGGCLPGDPNCVPIEVPPPQASYASGVRVDGFQLELGLQEIMLKDPDLFRWGVWGRSVGAIGPKDKSAVDIINEAVDANKALQADRHGFPILNIDGTPAQVYRGQNQADAEKDPDKSKIRKASSEQAEQGDPPNRVLFVRTRIQMALAERSSTGNAVKWHTKEKDLVQIPENEAHRLSLTTKKENKLVAAGLVVMRSSDGTFGKNPPADGSAGMVWAWNGTPQELYLAIGPVNTGEEHDTVPHVLLRADARAQVGFGPDDDNVKVGPVDSPLDDTVKFKSANGEFGVHKP